jgi:uncharacterized protein YqgQ
MSKTTFIIPIRIDSPKRLENINIVTQYLLKWTDSKIIVTERDTERKVFLPESSRIKYQFQHMENGIFHRTKILNEMLNMVDTEITSNYDADVILHRESYQKAEKMIVDEKSDLVYPFGFDKYNQHKVVNTNKQYNIFQKTLDHNDLLLGNFEKAICRWGHVQFFKTSSYKTGFMENENFQEYAERGIRFQKLGYKVAFFENDLFHLEHPINPKLIPDLKSKGEKLFSVLEKMNKQQLIDYYENQSYYKKYRK